LKIKQSKLDDSGIFVCRGINGFGKTEVNIQLIVNDPNQNPSEKQSRPSFSTETKVAPLHYFRKIGETFSVTCEAMGSPTPEIVWRKDGRLVSSNVRYIHAGKSSYELVILDTNDAGLYSCLARNAFGSVTRNYSLEVSSLGLLASMDSSPAASVVVTGISPRNSTLHIGQSGRLSCSVRSHETPHIKWLKQVNDYPGGQEISESANIINVDENRYQILVSAQNIKLKANEYINILTLEDVSLQDNGTYICLVAKNGFTSLTFKSATVFVTSGRVASIGNTKDGQSMEDKVALEQGQISLSMMLVIICLAVASVACLMILATWYIRYMRGPKTNTSNTGTSESSLPESPDDHFTHMKYHNFVYGGGGQFWGTQNIYPVSPQYPLLNQYWPNNTQQSQQQKVTFRSSSHEILEDNQYEVPFGHLMPNKRLTGPYQITGGSLSSVNLQQEPFLHQYPNFVPANIQRSTSMRPQFYG